MLHSLHLTSHAEKSDVILPMSVEHYFMLSRIHVNKIHTEGRTETGGN